jgi:predicted nucleotidyltransferase component of viral defense system
MAGTDYLTLYTLQDLVLETVFRTERIFYLTGGTCISRFYIEKRYSDDLDFFADSSPRFAFAVRNIRAELNKEFSLTEEVDTKDFVRFRINGILQIDFVNDLAQRYLEPVFLENGIIIDNIENILSNKLTAIIGRDNPKDIFDIYLISKYYSFSWEDILRAAHNKAVFLNDDLIVRLKSFPESLFRNIQCIDPYFLDNFSVEFPEVIREIEDAI